MSRAAKNSVKETLVQILQEMGVYYAPLQDLELKGDETYFDLMTMATDYIHNSIADEQEMD